MRKRASLKETMTGSLISIQKISSSGAWKIRGMIAAFAAYVLLSWQFSPWRIIHEIFPGSPLFNGRETSCILLNQTGIPCPFCGMSRSFTSLVQNDAAGVFYYNPSSVVFFTFITVICLIILVLSFFNKKIVLSNSRKITVIITAFIILIWVLNILFGHH